MPIQVNGKLRATIEISVDASQEEIKEAALKDENVQKFIQDKSIVKEIFVKGKIFNLVVK